MQLNLFPSLYGLDVYDPGHIIKLNTDMPHVIILAGIPTSGKSTWAAKFQVDYFDETPSTWYNIVCRDSIRLKIWDTNNYGKIKFSKRGEEEVTKRFNLLLGTYSCANKNMIIDQTNCKPAYLDALLKYFENTNYKVEVKFFDISLWKAFYRNLIRGWRTGKRIPWKVINDMKRNYDKIDKTKYNEYE